MKIGSEIKLFSGLHRSKIQKKLMEELLYLFVVEKDKLRCNVNKK